MVLTQRLTAAALFGALCLGLALAGGVRGAEAEVRRPTPHAGIDHAMVPVSTALTELRATEAERDGVADLVRRAEGFAAELVAAEHRGAVDVSQRRARWIGWVARALRGRVEAMRSEAAAAAAERAALESESRRTQARAALERLAERRAEIDRGGTVATMNLAPPDPPTVDAHYGRDAGSARAPGDADRPVSAPAHGPRKVSGSVP